jgi:hypothetical protein
LYSGDNGQFEKGNEYIDDEYNQTRVAADGDNKPSWWFLRAPYSHDNLAMCVGDDGCIYVTRHGITVKTAGFGGVRPALWLNISKK